MELLGQGQGGGDVLAESGWGQSRPFSALETLTETHQSHELVVASSKGRFSAAGSCQIFPARTQGLTYPFRSAFHVSLPKEGLGRRQTPVNCSDQSPGAGRLFCWNQLHPLPLYVASSPDILLRFLLPAL